jgi:hypothetical protein
VSLNTGGTPALTTANPGVTTQIASHDTGQNTNLSATAVLVSYTAAPTNVDTAPVYIGAQMLTMPVVTSVMPALPVDFHSSWDVQNNLQAYTLRGASQQLCVNNTAALTNASSWAGQITWTEE